ncbi:hypothetical protein Tco_0281059 [Tanacetum coccineum]
MSFGVATLRAVVHTGDKTSGDARSWYMISGDAKYVLIKVNGWFWRLKMCTLGDLRFKTKIGNQSQGILIPFTLLSQVMSTPTYVDSETITQADKAQSSQVLVPLPDEPYVGVRKAQLVDTNIKSDLEEAPQRQRSRIH